MSTIIAFVYFCGQTIICIFKLTVERCIQYQFRSEIGPEQVACLCRMKRHFLKNYVRRSLSGKARANGIKGTTSQVDFSVE